MTNRRPEDSPADAERRAALHRIAEEAESGRRCWLPLRRTAETDGGEPAASVEPTGEIQGGTS